MDMTRAEICNCFNGFIVGRIGVTRSETSMEARPALTRVHAHTVHTKLRSGLAVLAGRGIVAGRACRQP